jgi:ATP-dependent DNA helicase RecG
VIEKTSDTTVIDFTSPLTVIFGVGEKRAALFRKVGVETIADLIGYFPRAYQNRGTITPLKSAHDGMTGAFLLAVSTAPIETLVRSGMLITKFWAADVSEPTALGSCQVTFFNNRYVKSTFSVGETFRFYGKIRTADGTIMLSSPDYERYNGESLPPFVPLYKLTAGLTQKITAMTVRNTLRRLSELNEQNGLINKYDAISEDIRLRNDLYDLKTAIAAIHMPENYEMIEKARRRFAFEEFMIFALGAALLKQRIETADALPMLKNVKMKALFALLPYKPTKAQLRCIGEISADMSVQATKPMSTPPKPMSTPSRPMARLVSGDVGSGKTLCAAAAVYIAVANGYQAALMVPTEILAVQHYNDLSVLFAELGITCALLTGSLKAAEKRRIHGMTADGTAQLVIGTHALISEGVKFANLGLVITDEQHRFGIEQRSRLSARGTNPHTLIMSATPIPRTLALILYADLDISVIDEMPPGRKKIITKAFGSNKRKSVYRSVARELSKGRQVYVVAPLIEDGEDSGIMEGVRSAESLCEELKETFKDYEVCLLHGGMKSAEKDYIMSAMSEGRIQVLISTVVIEVGINVPNATVMVVENAERFGLAQLHQLRGRVGRGSEQSYCILITDSRAEEAVRRAETLVSTDDGYLIAEQDLSMRGPGELFGLRQHGIPNLHIADPLKHIKILNKVRREAQRLLSEDPRLESPENAGLRVRINGLFEQVSDIGM